MLLTVLELISQGSNFSRITILRNGVFSFKKNEKKIEKNWKKIKLKLQ